MGFNFCNHFICDLYSELQQHCESKTRYPIPKQLDEHVWMSASLRLHAYWFPRSSLGPETALLQMSVEQFLFVHVSCFMNPSSERVPAFLPSLQVAQLEHKTALASQTGINLEKQPFHLRLSHPVSVLWHADLC